MASKPSATVVPGTTFVDPNVPTEEPIIQPEKVPEDILPVTQYISDPYSVTGENLHEQNPTKTETGQSDPVYYAAKPPGEDPDPPMMTSVEGGDQNPWAGTDLAAVDMNVDYRQLYNDAADAGASTAVLNRITELRNMKIAAGQQTGKVFTEWDGTVAQQITEPYMYNQPVVDAYTKQGGTLHSLLPDSMMQALAATSADWAMPYTAGYDAKTYTSEMMKLQQQTKQQYRPQTWGLDTGTFSPVTSQQDIENQKFIQGYRSAGKTPYKPKKVPGPVNSSIDQYYTTKAVKAQLDARGL